MSTPAEIMDITAADMNDSAQENYTDLALLPYFNMALRELLERFEENQIPVTNNTTSPDILCPAGTTEIGYGGVPPLPNDLIEVNQMWESTDEGMSWMPLSRVTYINPNISDNHELSYFGRYAWKNNAIIVPPALNDVLVRIQYVARLVVIPVPLANVDDDINVRGCELFVGHKTAALCSMLSLQDTERATALNMLAEEAMARQLNVPTKAAQAITSRRRPFRQTYKTLGWSR